VFRFRRLRHDYSATTVQESDYNLYVGAMNTNPRSKGEGLDPCQKEALSTTVKLGEKDSMSNLSRPLGLFMFGMGAIFLAMVYTYIGKVWDHSSGWIQRAKDPKGYWFAIAVHYLLGLGFVAYYLYKIHAFSN